MFACRETASLALAATPLWSEKINRSIHGSLRVIRWMFIIFVVLIVFSELLPWLEKFGIGRLPGDVRFTLFGRTFFLPFASTVLLSLLVFVLARLL